MTSAAGSDVIVPGDEPVTVVLVRHGESMATLRRVIGGQRTCAGLSDLGRLQARALADRLAQSTTPTVDALYSSGYLRARQTADLLAPALGLEVSVDEGFGEHDPGPDCDGLSFEEFLDRFGMPDWESDPFATTFPGGETIAAFHHRVLSALHHLVDRHRGATVMIVCHGGVIDAILRHAMRTPPTGVFELYTKTTSLTELMLVRPGRWRLLRYNDAAHLDALGERVGS